MTAVAAFDVLTDVDPETVKSNLIELWVGILVNVRVDPQTKVTSCILEYIFDEPEEEKSIRDIVDYLFSISNNGWIYYYPDIEVYGMSDSDDDEAIEISVDDIFTKKYKPSLNSPFGYARFIIKKHLNQSKNMTAVAAFDVLTDENPETVKSNLTKLWIWKVVKIVPDTKNKSFVYIG